MNWIYQLQGVRPHILGSTLASVKVVDAYDDHGIPWTKENVSVMRGSPDTKLLSYLSIGEAEDYRSYWRKEWNEGRRPTWIDHENTDWPGNFKVHYWTPEWKAIVFKQLDAIIAQGFDGVYLDIIDAYEYYEEHYSRRDYAAEMVKFVIEIAAHARASKGGRFWIVPQNGEGLLDNPRYVSTIDAIGKEDIFYGTDGDARRNAPNYTEIVLDELKPLLAQRKPVLAVEYGLTGTAKNIVRDKAREHGLVMYFAERHLETLSAPEPLSIT